MQNTLITREVINKNIKYTGCTDNQDSGKLYDYNDLCREIDRFKNILQYNNAKKEDNSARELVPPPDPEEMKK